MTISEVRNMTMNKYLFEDWLRNRLDDLVPEELDRVCAFYRSAIDERMDEGMTEEQAIHDLGEPEKLLTEIRASLPESAFLRVGQGFDTDRERTHRRDLRKVALPVAVGLAFVMALVTVLGVNYTGVTRVDVSVPSEAPVAIEAWPDYLSGTYWEQGYEDWPQEAWEIIHFEIETDMGNITLEPSPDEIIHIWTNSPDELSLTQRGSSLYAEQDTGDLIVQIPSSYQGQYIMDIRADLGDIQLYDCRPRSLSVRADLGSITLSHMTVEDHLLLEADIGPITGSIADSKESFSASLSGHFTGNLNEWEGTGSKKLEISCDVGTVDVTFEWE